MQKGMSELLRAVKAGEQSALEMLVDLFDWLDGLEPQPTREIFPLYEEPQRTVDGLAPSFQNSVVRFSHLSHISPSLDDMNDL